MLFKILRGPSSRISKDTTEFHDGYAYFTPDDGGFYIDAATESTDPGGTVQQKRIRVNPVMSVNGSTGDVILPTVFVVKLSGSGTTADPYVTDKTFDELNEAYDRGDICILRFDREAVEFALTYMYADLAYFNRLFLSGSKTMQEVSWDGNSGKIQVTTIDIRESLDQSVTGQEIPTAEAVWNAIPHPEAKTDAQTQSVGADSDGKLWTAPSPVMSVNNKTGAVSLTASDVSAIPSNLTGTAGQVLTKTANGQEWRDETPRDVYFHVNGLLQNQDLQIVDAGTLSDLTNEWNQLVLSGSGDFKNVNIPMPCIDARYNSDNEGTIILRYAGIGLNDQLAYFTGIYYDASAELQYSVSLLYQLGEPGFQQYKIIPVKDVSPSTTTPLAPTEAGAVGTSTTYARGDHSHPKELPVVTTADNGKFLRVVSGAWAAVEIASANGGSF